MDQYGYCYSYPPYDQLMDYLRDSSEEVDFLSQENASLRQENSTLRLVYFLSQENSTLRLVNTDLKNQLTESSVNQFNLSPESPSLPIIKGIGDNNGIGGGPTKNNNHRVGPSREAPVTSPTSVLGNHDKGFDEKPEIVSLAKSISTRHSAYLKMNRLKPPPIKTSNRLRASAAPFVPGNTRQVQQPTVPAVDESKKEEVDPLVYYTQGMPKTELCNKWQRRGVCPYGVRCQFAHGDGELRPVIRHPKYRTVVCRTVLAGYICPFGHRCHFRHALTDQENA
ncbi:hypothetical protein MKW94_028282 [Papaver nudicaule]|uniref:C3H1-type domain-containing protein n=1 Tax=Papaver nudicaule TaxID=74823 RepID=A0AA41S8Y3_PAPNU|nr:hypothetical protein [Papaver nudicaule]